MRKRTHYARNLDLNLIYAFYWDLRNNGEGYHSYYLALDLTGQEMIQRRDKHRR